MNKGRNVTAIVIGIVLLVLGISMAVYGFSSHTSYGPSYKKNGLNITLAESKVNNGVVGLIGIVLGIAGIVTVKNSASKKGGSSSNNSISNNGPTSVNSSPTINNTTQINNVNPINSIENNAPSDVIKCRGEEFIVFENSDVGVWLNYRGKCINKGGIGSPLNGKLTLTNYKVTYETSDPNTSFSKSLDTLISVTTHMKIMIKLVFSDEYDVQFPSLLKTADDAEDWAEIINSMLF